MADTLRAAILLIALVAATAAVAVEQPPEGDPGLWMPKDSVQHTHVAENGTQCIHTPHVYTSVPNETGYDSHGCSEAMGGDDD